MKRLNQESRPCEPTHQRRCGRRCSCPYPPRSKSTHHRSTRGIDDLVQCEDTDPGFHGSTPLRSCSGGRWRLTSWSRGMGALMWPARACDTPIIGFQGRQVSWELGGPGRGALRGSCEFVFSATGVESAFRALVRHLQTVINPGLGDGAGRQTFC